MLSKHILQRLCQQWNLPLPQLSDHAWQALKSYSFPGNVRELENILERALTLSDGRQIDTAHLQLPDSEPSFAVEDRKSTRLNSSHVRISYAVFCLKKKKKKQ